MKNVHHSLARAAFLVALLICSACESSPLAAEDASFTARVARTSAGDLMTDSVSYVGSGRFTTDTVIVHVAKGVRVFAEAPDGSFTSVAHDQLAVGQKLRVWTTGTEIRTGLLQYTARQLIILH